MQVESDRYLSSLLRPSSHREFGEFADAVGIRNLAEVREGVRNLLARVHRNRSSFALPMHRRDWDCTSHTRWMEVDNAYIVVAPGAAAADEAAADDGLVQDVEEEATRRRGVWVGLGGYTQRAGDSASLPGSELAVGLSRLEWGFVGEAEYRVRCTHSVGGTGAEQALEAEGKCNGVHTSRTSEG